MEDGSVMNVVGSTGTKIQMQRITLSTVHKFVTNVIYTAR